MATDSKKLVVERRRRSSSASGIRRRVDDDDLKRSVLAGTERVVARASSARAAFPEIAALIHRVLPLQGAAIVPVEARARPIVWCAEEHERDLVESEAIAIATFGGDAPTLLRWSTFSLETGVLVVASSRAPFDDTATEMLEKIAAALAPLVERAPDSMRALREPLLRELTTRIFETLDYGSTLADVARVIGMRGGRGCLIQIAGEPPRSFAHPAALAEHTVARVIHSLFVTVGITGEALRGEEATARFAAALLGVESIATVPLRARGAVIGALAVIDADRAALPMSDLEELGRRIGAAVHNGRAYERAMQTLRARDEVLSTVSHDLQTPLSTILLSAARMLEEDAANGSPGRARLERIQRSATRMRRLVGDLLDVAAIESGALALEVEECDAAELVREAIDGATPAATEAGVTLDADFIADEDGRVLVDPERVLQVLRNLLGNAIKFTPAGGRVTVRTRIEGNMLAIDVVDDGIGIDETELPRIFDRFWQADGARQHGSGLGLAICRSLVERWQGDIRAISARDAGTMMTFTVPRADQRRRGPTRT